MKRKSNIALDRRDLRYIDPEVLARATADPPPLPDPSLQYIHHDIACVERKCNKSWSQKWPRSIAKPYTEILEHFERSLTGNGWARTWLGGWRCLDCRKARAARHKAQAPWVFRAGVIMGLATGVYYILVGLGVVG